MSNKMLNAQGILANTFDIGLSKTGGARINVVNGLVQFLGSDKRTLTRIQTATPSAANDATNKTYVDTKIAEECQEAMITCTVASDFSVTAGDIVEMTASGIVPTNVGAIIDDTTNEYSTGLRIIGIAKETKAGGESCVVSVGPIVKGFTNVEIGTVYYCTTEGKITTTQTIYKVGIGLTSSSIKLDLGIVPIVAIN